MALQISPTNGDGADAFVTKLNAAGSALVYSTYLGGSMADDGALASRWTPPATPTSRAVTSSADFPTLNALQPATAVSGDAFVTKLNAAGSALVYSTYLGGGGTRRRPWHRGGLAPATPMSTGVTTSARFPRRPAPCRHARRRCRRCVRDEAQCRGPALVYSTYLGGSDAERVQWHRAWTAPATPMSRESTASTDFPTSNALQPVTPAALTCDAFVAKLNAAGSGSSIPLTSAASGRRSGAGIAVDCSGNAYVTGSTCSTDFPTVNPLQSQLAATTTLTLRGED